MSEQFLHGIEVVEVDDGVRPIRRVGRQEPRQGRRSDHWRTLNDASIDTQAALQFAPKPSVVDSKTICRATIRLAAIFNLFQNAGIGPWNRFWELVGERGFEPPTLRSQSECATGLRHSPPSRDPIDIGFQCPALKYQLAKFPKVRMNHVIANRDTELFHGSARNFQDRPDRFGRRNAIQ